MNTLAAAYAKCPCNNCNAKIEFEIAHAGETVPCPHCGMDTVLFVPYVASPPKIPATPPPIPQAPAPMPVYDHRASYCQHCGTVGYPHSHTQGSFIIECFLWLMFLVPGIIYSLWRLTSRRKVCPTCEEPGMIPVQSPIAQRALYG